MRPALLAFTLSLALPASLIASGDAWAQFGGGGGMRPMGPGGTPGGPTQGPDTKEEGPAEAAPDRVPWRARHRSRRDRAQLARRPVHGPGLAE